MAGARSKLRSFPGLFFLLFFFNSVSCPFQDYFTHRDEPIDRWGKTGVPQENHLTQPQAELVLSHVASAGLEPTPDTAVR